VTERRIVIVGAGQAAGRCPEALRASGYAGAITLIGDEPHLPYERPPLSKEFLEGSAAFENLLIRSAAWYQENRVTVRQATRVTSVDRKEKKISVKGGPPVDYDVAVLATGSRVRPIPIPGNDLPGVHYLRNLEDSLALRSRLIPGTHIAILGAGLIGLEVAAWAVTMGCIVHVIEVNAWPMARFVSDEIGKLYAELHRSKGVTLHTLTAVQNIQKNGSGLQLALGNGTSLDADVVVVGIGVVPNVEVAETCGLDVSNGIVVDEFGVTSDPDIYAIGDCANFYHPMLGRRLRLETWRHAQNHAIAVARNIAGIRAPYVEVPWAWSNQYGINLQIAGAPESWDQTVWRGDPHTHQALLFYLSDQTIVAVNGMNTPREMRAAQKLIASGAKVDPDRLAMPAVKLEQAVLQP
jgi:3-phenylpropionate/trans-cinnamate dioxygenase ferredoxin reductase subunit